MIEPVKIDKKGRMVLPKRIRAKAGIRSGSTLLVEVTGQGIVELRDSTALLDRVQRVAVKKLTGWKEEEHREDRLLLKAGKVSPSRV